MKVITQPTATLFPLVGGTYAGAIHVEAERDIELVAVAGHTYIPRAGKDVSGKIVVYLEDMGTGFSQECLGAFLAGSNSGC